MLSSDNSQKGGSYVVDNCGSTHNIMAVRAAYRLHNGIFYSYPVGHRYNSHTGQGNSGSERQVAIK